MQITRENANYVIMVKILGSDYDSPNHISNIIKNTQYNPKDFMASWPILEYHNILVSCHFAGYHRPWETVVVVLVVLWLCGVAVVLIIIFLIWRQAKQEDTAGWLRATFH